MFVCCLTNLDEYPNRSIGVFAKIESSDSLKNLEDIIRVSDGAMVARGDLGAQIPLEQVPSVQQAIVSLCRELNKPVIVASQLLESMIEFPTPTRAEVRTLAFPLPFQYKSCHENQPILTLSRIHIT